MFTGEVSETQLRGLYARALGLNSDQADPRRSQTRGNFSTETPGTAGSTRRSVSPSQSWTYSHAAVRAHPPVSGRELWWNRVVPDNEDARPPMYFGNYPHGAYWSAERHAAPEEDEPADQAVSGPMIRFMWDYGVRIPLWDAEGLLPDNSEWLRGVLGLSDPLIEDLSRWGRDMEALDAAPSRRTAEAYEALDARARELVQRLQQEFGSRFSVEYQPW